MLQSFKRRCNHRPGRKTEAHNLNLYRPGDPHQSGSSPSQWRLHENPPDVLIHPLHSIAKTSEPVVMIHALHDSCCVRNFPTPLRGMFLARCVAEIVTRASCSGRKGQAETHGRRKIFPAADEKLRGCSVAVQCSERGVARLGVCGEVSLTSEA
jgi:hypothetical protein